MSYRWPVVGMKVLRERFYKSETLLTSVPNNEFVSHRRSADCANSNFDRFRNRERYRSRYRKRYSLPVSEAIDFRLLDLSSETLSLENWNGSTPGAPRTELPRSASPNPVCESNSSGFIRILLVVSRIPGWIFMIAPISQCSLD